MTNYSSQANTLSLTRCHKCGAELLQTDKFCRRCGIKQPDDETRNANKATVLLDQTSGELDTEDLLTEDWLIDYEPLHYATSPLNAAESVSANLTSDISLSALRAYHKVSGSLVQQMASNFSNRFISRTRNLLMQKTVIALVSIPIWLLIILLSPLDAYAAAKAVTRQI